jgi:hypothetical protein
MANVFCADQMKLPFGENINEFQSPSEFNRFVQWMAEETKTVNAEYLTAQKPHLEEIF